MQRAVAGWAGRAHPRAAGPGSVHPRQQGLGSRSGCGLRPAPPLRAGPPGDGSARDGRRVGRRQLEARVRGLARTTNSWTAGSLPGWRRSRTLARRRAPARAGPRSPAPGADRAAHGWWPGPSGTDSRQQSVKVRRGGQQMLQVVHQQQDRPLPEERRQRLEGIPGRAARAPHPRAIVGATRAGIGQRRQIDEPDASGKRSLPAPRRRPPGAPCRRLRDRSASAGERRPGRGGCGGRPARPRARSVALAAAGDAWGCGGVAGVMGTVHGPACDQAGGWARRALRPSPWRPLSPAHV